MEKNKLSLYKFLLIGHYATFAEADMLLDYLKDNKAKLIERINLPLPELPYMKKANIEIYEQGKIKESRKTLSFIKPIWLAYILQSFQLMFFVFSSKRTFDILIAQDSLLAFLGIIFRTFGKCKKVIFFSHGIDKQRFGNSILNSLYCLLDSFSARRSDFNWFMSKNMIPIRRKQKIKDGAMFWIPSTVPIKLIKRKEVGKKHTIVFLGTVDDKNGALLLPKMMLEVIKNIPDAVLDVMGDGPLFGWLKKEVNKLSLKNNVNLLGHMKFKDFSTKLTNYSIGISPYKFSEQNLTPLSDSLKMRLYLAAGLPVVITKGFWFSDEIAENKLGFAVGDNADNFAKAIIKLFKDEKINFEIRKRAFAYSKKFDLTGFYDRAFNNVISTFHEKI